MQLFSHIELCNYRNFTLFQGYLIQGNATHQWTGRLEHLVLGALIDRLNIRRFISPMRLPLLVKKIP